MKEQNFVTVSLLRTKRDEMPKLKMVERKEKVIFRTVFQNFQYLPQDAKKVYGPRGCAMKVFL
jgi:hypothetical protein